MSNYTFDFVQADAVLTDMNNINKKIQTSIDEMESTVEASLKEHREICAAIAACDLSAATEALDNHLRNVQELITALARERGLDQRTRERSA